MQPVTKRRDQPAVDYCEWFRVGQKKGASSMAKPLFGTFVADRKSKSWARDPWRDMVTWR
jgi:hypothetical protein